VIGSLALGGAEIQLVRLVNGLDRNRFQPSIICISERGVLLDSLEKDVSVAFTPVWAQKTSSRRARSRMLLAAQILIRLAGSIREQRPDIVHSYLPAAYVLGSIAAWLVRVPLIVAGRRAMTQPDHYGTLRWRNLARLANRVIDLHVCNSIAVQRVAAQEEGIKPERTRVVYNGIDLPPLAAPVSLPREWQSVGGHAAMVANLIHYKGHRHVLQAVAQVVKRYPSFLLVLIGDGPERKALTDLVQELGISRNVLFAGRRPDAPRLLGAFDFTVLGSSEEGFPNAVMESMALAVPVVATAVGGLPELVEDGVHGKLVPFGNVGAMAEAMAWMLDHSAERSAMGRRGRERIERCFSTKQMVEATESAYEEFLPKLPLPRA